MDLNFVILINGKFFFGIIALHTILFSTINQTYSSREVRTFKNNNTLQIKPKCMYAQGQKVQTFSVVRVFVNFANITDTPRPYLAIKRAYIYPLCIQTQDLLYVHGQTDEYELANSTETVDSRGYSPSLGTILLSLRPVCPFVFNFAMMLATLITPVFLHPRSEFNGASFLFRNVVTPVKGRQL